MRAVLGEQYGPPEVLRLADVPQPQIGKSDVLVRVHAAGLHVGDCFTVQGRPFIVRMETGWRRPTVGIPGYDFSGVVEQVGGSVKSFHTGEEVFGYCSGSCAEFVAVSEDKLAPKPRELSFCQAAAMPTSASAALHALRDVAKLQPDQTVLVNGASGGVGTFAVQIAKIFGAEVTGVCSRKNISLVKSLGADHVVDYTTEDFTEAVQHYDCIFDNVENRSLSDVRRALKSTGTLICNSGTGATGMAFWIRLLKPLIISPMSRQTLCRYLSIPNRRDLDWLSEMVREGKLRPIVSEVYELDAVPFALKELDAGRTIGKRVVRVVSD